MGKKHRIKKSFYKLMAQKPWQDIRQNQAQCHKIAYGIQITVIKNRETFVINFVDSYWGNSYKALIKRLIANHMREIANGDESSAKS